MREAILRATGQGQYRRFPTALCFEQDVYLIPRRFTSRLGALQLSRGPQGTVDEIRTTGSDLDLRGCGDPGRRSDVAWVELRLDDVLIARVQPSSPRPDVARSLHAERKRDCIASGWEVTLRLPRPPTSDQVLTVRAVTRQRESGVVWSLPLADAPGGELLAAPDAAPAARSDGPDGPLATLAHRAVAVYEAGGLGAVVRAGARRTRSGSAQTLRRLKPSVRAGR